MNKKGHGTKTIENDFGVGIDTGGGLIERDSIIRTGAEELTGMGDG